METASPSCCAQLLVFLPRQLEDALSLIRAVKGNQAVVLNASTAEAAETQRLLDCAHGGMMAIDDQNHLIDAETFLLTPALAGWSIGR